MVHGALQKARVKAQAYITALLRRGLHIGYGRAASLIDKLEAKGIDEPNPGGNTPREVLISDMDKYKDWIKIATARPLFLPLQQFPQSALQSNHEHLQRFTTALR